ncbi:MAG: tetratricopeptide repeat protein [Hyphomicrobiales bacterium]|nr:tetratricopeptide repeat protein [Hyphomicrobiales bacterium]
MTVLGKREAAGASALGKASRFAAVVATLLLLVACSDPKAREAENIERGKALFASGELAVAKVAFKNANQINPKNAEALYYLGRINESEEKWPQALTNYLQIVFEHPRHLPAQLRLGYLFMWNGQMDQAYAQAQTAAALAPRDVEVLILQGAVSLRQGYLGEARNFSEAALRAQPANPQAGLLAARVLAASGEVGRALDQLVISLEQNTDDLSLLTYKAELHVAESDMAAVQAVYDRIFELRPDDFAYKLALARIYASRDRVDDAEKVLRDAVAAGIGGNEAKFALAQLLVQRRSPEAAFQVLRKFVAADPANHVLSFKLADMLAEHGNLAEAKTVLRSVIDRAEPGKDYATAQAGLAHLARAEGNTAQAKMLVNAALQGGFDGPDALILRARLALDETRADAAISDLRDALRLAPDSKTALQLLSIAQLVNGEVALAVDTLRRLIALHPEELSAKQDLASLLASQGEREEALHLIDEVIEVQPSMIDPLRAKAALLIARGNWSQAERVIAAITRAPGGHLPGTELSGALALSRGEYDTALDQFKQVREQAPNPDAAVAGMVIAALGQQDFASAQKILQERLAEAPENAPSHLLLGHLLALEGDSEGAAAAYAKATAVQPDWYAPYLALARIRLSGGDRDAAVSVLQAGVDRAAWKAPLLLVLGQVQILNEEYEAATVTYKRALKLVPSSLIAANNLAALISDFQYQDQEALNASLPLIELLERSNEPEYLDTLGWLQYRLGDLGRSAVNLELAAKQRPDNPQILYHFGVVESERGNIELALAALRKAVQKGASYPGLEDAKDRLKRLSEGN